MWTSVDSTGDTINYTYTVTNTGNAAIAGVVVTDDNLTPGIPGDDFNPAFSGGDTDSDGMLDVGETWTYTAAHTVTQAELDSNGGGDGLDNVATATGTGADPDTDDATVPVAQTPALNIVKERDAGADRADGGRGRRRDQLHDHGSEHRQHDADRGGGDRSECGCGLDRARRRRGWRQRRPARGRRDLELHGGAHRDAGRDRQQRRRRRRHRQHGDGRQRPDRSGHRRCHGAGGADPGAEHHEGGTTCTATRPLRWWMRPET